MFYRRQLILILSGMMISISGISEDSIKLVPLKDFEFVSGNAEPATRSRYPVYLRKFKAYVEGKELYSFERDMARLIITGDSASSIKAREQQEADRRAFEKHEPFERAPETTHIAVLKGKETVKLFQIQTLKEPKKYETLSDGLSLNRNKNVSSAKRYTFSPNYFGHDLLIDFSEYKNKACLFLNVPADHGVEFEKERGLIGGDAIPAHWREKTAKFSVEISCVEASSEKEANSKLSALKKQFEDLIAKARDRKVKLQVYGEPFEWEYLALQEPVGAPHQKAAPPMAESKNHR